MLSPLVSTSVVLFLKHFEKCYKILFEHKTGLSCCRTGIQPNYLRITGAQPDRALRIADGYDSGFNRQSLF